MYKLLQKNTRPLPLGIPSEDFSEEWKKCIGDPNSDLTFLFELMDPVFTHWSNFLSRKTLENDINFNTLCRLLSEDADEALKMIDDWINWIEQNSSSLEDELKYIFLERTRKIRYEPTLARPVMVEYIVAKDFKLGIYHRIRSICRYIKRDAFFYLDPSDFEIATTFKMKDFLLIKNLDLNAWQSYLLYLLKEGYTSVERSNLTKTHRRNLYNEEKEIWQLLNQKH